MVAYYPCSAENAIARISAAVRLSNRPHACAPWYALAFVKELPKARQLRFQAAAIGFGHVADGGQQDENLGIGFLRLGARGKAVLQPGTDQCDELAIRLGTQFRKLGIPIHETLRLSI
jgi:hypothetical protein